MKKISILFCSLLALVCFSSCSPEDDTSFNAPMIDDEGGNLNPGGGGNQGGGNQGGNQGGNATIDRYCSDYTLEATQGNASLYYCNDDDEYYACTASACVIDD